MAFYPCKLYQFPSRVRDSGESVNQVGVLDVAADLGLFMSKDSGCCLDDSFVVAPDCNFLGRVAPAEEAECQPGAQY